MFVLLIDLHKIEALNLVSIYYIPQAFRVIVLTSRVDKE